ncbi:MAG: hypothetical protein MZU95_01025 [Desulfomicrobium escambiense]|nr:hypothetical protein [Desulfomicrobium escambiense]
MTALGLDEAFRFACGPEVACFNDCCRDLNQALTPYDALRLKRGLGLPSGRFLAQFTRRHTGPGSGLPVVTLAPADPANAWPARLCPRPAAGSTRTARPPAAPTRSCARCAARGRRVPPSHYLFILTEPHCRGFAGNRTQTARQWTADQGIGDYNAENDRMLEVISLKNSLQSRAAVAVVGRTCLHRPLRPGRIPPPALRRRRRGRVGVGTKSCWRPPATTSLRCCGWDWNG